MECVNEVSNIHATNLWAFFWVVVCCAFMYVTVMFLDGEWPHQRRQKAERDRERFPFDYRHSRQS